ncbi:site-specific integrase [Candidatus Woesearchaeota archaeon]|nr:site-specific integrase [Candidatus Woesearchaeota archaeon]
MSRKNIKNEIYDLENKYSRSLAVLAQDPKISANNKEIIKQYVEDHLALGITKTRGIMIIAQLRRLAHFTKASLNELQEKDIKQLMATLESKDYSDWTKVTTKKVLKAYLRTLDKPENLLKWIRCQTPQTTIRAEDLLTEEEMSSMVAAADKPMWKALLAVLFETGVRPGELLGMRIKDVILNEHKAKAIIYVAGKTEKKQGERQVRVYQKTYPLIKAWLSMHPLRKEQDSPLWLTPKNKALTLESLNRIYNNISKSSGRTKGNWPYLARHSRLTQFYRDFGSAIGSKLSGHIPGSKEVRTYLHLSDSDVEDAMDAFHGLKEKKPNSDSQNCPKCNTTNAYGEIICTNCHSALNSAGAVVVESERDEELNSLKDRLQEYDSILSSENLKLLQELNEAKKIKIIRAKMSQ